MTGACAVVCGLQLSGLPTDKFMFAGFIPNKDKARKEIISKYKNIDATVVFYETAKRLIKTLEAISDVLGEREIAVAREITKMYEECKNGTATDLINYYTETPPKGEIVLMIAPSLEKEDVDYIDELKQELKQNSLKTAVKNIFDKYNLNKNEVYQTALGIKNGN
jgi:16S rRNA (cytidine1402-2'-O)-methyltransferase